MAAATLGQIRSDVNNFPLAPLPDEPEVLICEVWANERGYYRSPRDAP